VINLDGEHAPPGPGFGLGEDCDPGVPGTRVNTDLDTPHDAVREHPVNQEDHERGVMMNPGTTRLEQLTGTRRGGGLQWCAVLVHDKHGRVRGYGGVTALIARH
jgi:hypothetical protein